VNAVNLYHYLSLRRRTDRAVSFGRTLACYMIVCKRVSVWLFSFEDQPYVGEDLAFHTAPLFVAPVGR